MSYLRGFVLVAGGWVALGGFMCAIDLICHQFGWNTAAVLLVLIILCSGTFVFGEALKEQERKP